MLPFFSKGLVNSGTAAGTFCKTPSLFTKSRNNLGALVNKPFIKNLNILVHMLENSIKLMHVMLLWTS